VRRGREGSHARRRAAGREEKGGRIAKEQEMMTHEIVVIAISVPD
jgi:hypothetical protein